MCTNMPFKIYTENRYMGTMSLAIVSISISITIGDGTETWSTLITNLSGGISFAIENWQLSDVSVRGSV